MCNPECVFIVDSSMLLNELAIVRRIYLRAPQFDIQLYITSSTFQEINSYAGHTEGELNWLQHLAGRALEWISLVIKTQPRLYLYMQSSIEAIKNNISRDQPITSTARYIADGLKIKVCVLTKDEQFYAGAPKTLVTVNAVRKTKIEEMLEVVNRTKVEKPVQKDTPNESSNAKPETKDLVVGTLVAEQSASVKREAPPAEDQAELGPPTKRKLNSPPMTFSSGSKGQVDPLNRFKLPGGTQREQVK